MEKILKELQEGEAGFSHGVFFSSTLLAMLDSYEEMLKPRMVDGSKDALKTSVGAAKTWYRQRFNR